MALLAIFLKKISSCKFNQFLKIFSGKKIFKRQFKITTCACKWFGRKTIKKIHDFSITKLGKRKKHAA